MNSTKNENMTPEQFVEWAKAVDKLAKEVRPTRNRRPNAEDFMSAVELMFRSNGWDLNAYLKRAYINWASIKQ